MTLVDEYTDLEAKAAECEREYWLRWVRQSEETLAAFARGMDSTRKKIAEVKKKWRITDEEVIV